MSLEPQSSEGIIMKVVDFREYDQILTILTPHQGLIKLFMKKFKPSASKPIIKLSPITKVEFQYTEGKNGMGKCLEIHPLDSYLKLREKLSFLETAGKLINAILSSQIDYRPIPLIYNLLSFYLEKIPTIPHLKAFEASFLIKIIKHDGLLNAELSCSLCQKELLTVCIHQHEHFCETHAPLDSLKLNADEFLAYLQLAACQSLSELNLLEIPELLPSKIELLFSCKISH